MSRRVNRKPLICHNEYGSSETSTSANKWLITELPDKFIFRIVRWCRAHFPPFLLLQVSSPLGRICFDLHRHLPTSKDASASESFDLDLDFSCHSGSLQCRCASGSRQPMKLISSFAAIPFFFFFGFFTYGSRMFRRTNVSRIQRLMLFAIVLSLPDESEGVLLYFEFLGHGRNIPSNTGLFYFILFYLILFTLISIFETVSWYGNELFIIS